MSAVNQDWLGLTRLPTLQRTAAVGMLLAQNLTLKLLMEPAPLAVGVLGLAGWFAPQFRLLIWMPIPVTLISIVAFFVFLCRTVESDFSSMGFIGTDIAYHMSCCCLTIQIVMLFMKQFGRRLPIWWLGISGAGMVLSGDIRVSGHDRDKMLWITALYLTCWLIYAASSRIRLPSLSRRGRWVRATVLCLTVLASLVAGRSLAVAFHRHENQLERLIGGLFQARDSLQHRHGFSGGGGLNDVISMRQTGGGDIALHVKSVSSPGYLRGKVFDFYSRNRWHATGDEGVPALQSVGWSPEGSTAVTRRFQFEDHSRTIETLHVTPMGKRVSPFCFLPLNTVALQCNSNVLKVNRSGIVERLDCDGSLDYVVEVGVPVVTRLEDVDPKFLQIPDQVGPVATALARSLGRGKKTTQEKIMALNGFFHNEFQYELGLEMPRRVNRLDYFLSNRLSAHCEYFATAATLLFRLQGVPARYVTGYVVNDKNPYVGEWVVRNRDAHAWVEVYDAEQQQWVTVEPTPESGIPSDYPTTFWEEIRDAVRYLWGQLLEKMKTPEFWGELMEASKRFVVAGIALLLVGALFWGVQRLYFPDVFVTRRVIPLARERIHMDRYLSRRGMQRGRSETLLAFARRLESSSSLTTASDLANWYRDYATIRYDEQMKEDEVQLAQLQVRRRDLVLRTRTVAKGIK